MPGNAISLDDTALPANIGASASSQVEARSYLISRGMEWDAMGWVAYSGGLFHLLPNYSGNGMDIQISIAKESSYGWEVWDSN